MRDNVVLAIYPNARGFGYVCLEDQGNLIDYGRIRTHPLSNAKLLSRIKKLVAFMEPHLIILRDCREHMATKRSQRLVEDIEKEFTSSGYGMRKYSREQIKFVFAELNASTKREIAKKLAEHFGELKDRIPRPKKLWIEEDPNQAIFDALSLAMTHFYLTT